MSFMSGRRSESSASRRSLEEGEERDESKRRSRNLSEKKRRDQFNLLVTELSGMLSSSPRKMDKSTVLKGTIGFLKAHNEVSAKSQLEDTMEKWKPTFLTNEEFTFLMLEALDGFLMVLSSKGKILHVSQSVTSLLGHFPFDLVGSRIYDWVQGEDKTILRNLLDREHSKGGREREQGQRSDFVHPILINIRTGRMNERDGAGNYELVRLSGYRKPWIPHECGSDEYEGEEDEGDEGDEDGASLLSRRTVFVSTGRLVQFHFLREMSVVLDSTKTEFSSRHSLEWKFLFLDHRAPPIIGYLPFELLGTSGYDYYHMDDLEKVAACHERLMEFGEGTSGYYRFLTKGQQWIWLQTRYYITYHQWNAKAEFIVGTHRVIRYGDVMQQQIHTEASHELHSQVSLPKDKTFLETSGERGGGRRRAGSGLTCPIGAQFLPNQSEEPIPFPATNCLFGEPKLPEELTMEYGGGVGPVHTHLTSLSTLGNPLHGQNKRSRSEGIGGHSLLDIEGAVGEGGGGGGHILQEALLFKHAELQRRILEQQEELREVSQRLLQSQCGGESGSVPPVDMRQDEGG